MLAQPGGPFEQLLNVFELVMCILAQLVGWASDVFAAQLLGDDNELVDGVAANVGAVNLAHEMRIFRR